MVPDGPIKTCQIWFPVIERFVPIANLFLITDMLKLVKPNARKV